VIKHHLFALSMRSLNKVSLLCILPPQGYDGGDCCECTCVDGPTYACCDSSYGGYDCIEPSACSSGKDDANLILIIGIAAGSLAFVGIVITAAVCFWRKTRIPIPHPSPAPPEPFGPNNAVNQRKPTVPITTGNPVPVQPDHLGRPPPYGTNA